MFRYTLTAACTISAVTLAACGGEEATAPPPPSVASVQVTPSTNTLTALGATQQFTAVAKDGSGNTIPNKTFTWSSTNTSTATVNSSGLAAAVANGTTAITATVDGISGSASLTVAQAVSSVAVTPTSATLVSLGETVQLTANAFDANRNGISGTTFTWSSAADGIATVNASGLVTAVMNGSVAIAATADGVDGTAAIEVNQVATQLAFSVEPMTTEAGASIVPAVQVAIQDALGSTVAGATDAVTVAIETNAGAGALSGTLTVSAVNGVATFSDLSIQKAGAGYTLSVTSGPITGASTAPFDITPAAPTKLAFAAQPTDTQFDFPIAPAAEVTILDAFENTVTTATDAVTVAIGANPGGGTLSGTTAVNAVGGTASFADLSIDQSGPGYTLVATSGTLTAATSAAFDICGEPAASIDQQQTAIDATVGGLAIGSSSEQILAQVVTVGRCGLLEEVRFPVGCSVGDLTVEIQGVDGDIPDGAVLTSEVIPGSSLFSADPLSFRSLALSSPAFFSVGARFAIVLKSAGACGVFQGPVGDPYSGGDAFFDARPNPPGVWVPISLGTGRVDLPFQTVVR